MPRLAVGVLLASMAVHGQDEKKKEEVVLPTASEDLERGKKLYDGSCQLCHGPLGDGGKGANLAQAKLPRAQTDGDLARVIEIGIPGTEMPGAWHMTRREVTQVAAYVRTFGKTTREAAPGDAGRGRSLYFGKGGCQGCHTTKNPEGVLAGGLMGPDLSVIGSRRSVAHLREALVDPGASLPDYFMDTTVSMKSGGKINGRRLNEETFTIVVQDYGGKVHVIDKTNVAEVVKDRKKSPMPSYGGKLSASEIDDVVSFLVSLQEAR